MRNQTISLFIGIKISDKLQHQLDASNVTMKEFYNENNPEYLSINWIEDDKYLGKMVESGVDLEALNNLFRNIKSMVNMICPKYIFLDDAIKIFAIVPAQNHTYY